MSTKSKLKSKITFITTTTLSALALTTGVAATTAHADATTAPANEPATNQTETTTTQSSLKTQQDASRQAVADANKANNEAQGALTDAQNHLNDANTAANQDQTKVQSAQDSVNTASQAVTDAQSKVNAKSDALDDANAKQSAAQSQYDQAKQNDKANQAAVDAATKANDKAQQAVSDAQKQVDQAQNSVNAKQESANTADQNAQQAQQHVDHDQAAISQAQDGVKSATNDLNNAKDHDTVISQDQSAVKTAQDNKNAADQKVEQAQTELNQKNDAVNSATDGVKSAQATVDNLSKAGETGEIQQSIPVTQEWVNFIKNLQKRMLSDNNYDLTSDESAKILKLNQAITDAMPKDTATPNFINESTYNTGHTKTYYISDPTQAKIAVHFNNNNSLSDADLVDATRFLISILNPIREKLGEPLLQISQTSLDHMKAVVNAYNEDNWNFEAGLPTLSITGDDEGSVPDPAHQDQYGLHDKQVANRTLPNVGDETLSSTGGMKTAVFNHDAKPGDHGHYEYNINNWIKNRDDLHHYIFNQVFDLIFRDGKNPNHAKTLLGLHTIGNGTENRSNKVGVDFNKYNQLLIDFTNTTVKDTSTLIPLSSTGYDTNAIKSAHDALVSAQNNYDSFVKAHQTDSLDLAHILTEQEYQNNKSKYDADPNGDWANVYKASMDKYQTQQQALKPYLDAINNAQDKLDQVYFTKTSDGQDSHAQALANAKQALSDAQTKLASAQANAKTAQDAYNAAKSQADAAAKALADAQAKLSQDSSNVMSVADAQAKLDKANNALKTAQANLKQDAANLDKAKAVQASAHAALDAAKKAQASAQDALKSAQDHAAQTQAKLDETIKNNPSLSQAEDKLNQAKQNVQVAQSNYDKAVEKLAAAKSELTKAQDKLANAKQTAEASAQAVKTAQSLVNAAKAKAEETAKALAEAKSHLITDSQVYGDSVVIKSQTVHQATPSELTQPEIANPTAVDPTQNIAMGEFLKLASAKLDTIPTGTTAQWNQPSQVLSDLNRVGDYSEDVLVTFPDGSTTTVKMPLHVLVKTNVTPVVPDKPDKNNDNDNSKDNSGKTDTPSVDHHDGETSQDHSQTSQATGNHSQAGQTNIGSVVAPNESAGQSSIQGSTKTTDTVSSAMPTASLTNNSSVKRSDLNNGKLPQTSDKDQSGLVALGLVTLIGMFGLAGARRKN